MLFTQQEIQRLLEIVDYHSSFVTANTLGKEVLTDYDLFILRKHGIDPDQLLEQKQTSYFHMYLFGKLSQELNNIQAGKVTYQDFAKYISRGQYIPLNKIEQRRFDISKQKTYGHIKGLGDKIKNTVNGIIIEEDQKRREQYEKVIKKEISRGIVDRNNVKGIVQEIGNKLDDWGRDWNRIVDTEMNSIFQEGRAEKIREQSGGDALVFKEVFSGACKHCIRLYLTSGIGSKPIVFKLNELEANGDNIGKKVADWVASLKSLHPFCRCLTRQLPKGYEWNEESKSFQPKEKEKLDRPKVKITVGDKEFNV